MYTDILRREPFLLYFCEIQREFITNGERFIVVGHFWKKLEKSHWEDKQNHQLGKVRRARNRKNGEHWAASGLREEGSWSESEPKQ